MGLEVPETEPGPEPEPEPQPEAESVEPVPDSSGRTDGEGSTAVAPTAEEGEPPEQ